MQNYKYKGIIRSTSITGTMLNFVSGSDDMLISLADIITEKCKTKPRKIFIFILVLNVFWPLFRHRILSQVPIKSSKKAAKCRIFLVNFFAKYIHN